MTGAHRTLLVTIGVLFALSLGFAFALLATVNKVNNYNSRLQKIERVISSTVIQNRTLIATGKNSLTITVTVPCIKHKTC